MNFADIKLGELLSSSNEIIKRNALSILKQLQKSLIKDLHPCAQCGYEKSETTFIKQNGNTTLVAEHCPECSYDWRK